MEVGLVAVASYLVGAIPFGLLIPKIMKGIDIRRLGSGNIGATNVARNCGKTLGILVFLLDASKGFVPCWIFARMLAKANPDILLHHLHLLFGLAAILGHMFPIYLKFKGGKGVSTGTGVLIAVVPAETAAALVIWALVTFTSRHVSLGSMLAAASLPVWMCLNAKYHYWGETSHTTSGSIWILILCTVLLIFYQHRGNMKRLLAGTEHKIGRSR